MEADESNRYKKIVYNSDQIDRFFVEMFLDSHEREPEWIVIDADATDDPTYGEQEGHFFMVITVIIVIYLFILFVMVIFYVPVCVVLT